MQIINRALTRELTTNTLAVTFVFVALFMVVSSIKILAKAVTGAFPAKLIFTMLGLQTVEVLSLMLPLAFYIGLLLTLGRWYRDSEMTVLSACGVGLTQLLRPVLVMALGFAVVVGVLSFYLAPVASNLIARIKQDDTARYDVAAVTPGIFNEIASSGQQEGGVYYVEDINGKGEMRQVFVATTHLGRHGVLVARTGREMTDADTGDRFLALRNGVRYDGQPGQGDYRILDFEGYNIRIDIPPAALKHTPFYAMSTAQLLTERNRGAHAQWHWRISKPLSILVLTLFALVFAYTNPRQGRYYSLFVAIIAYFLYSNLLGVGDALLKRGKIVPEAGLWWVHVLFLLLGLFLFWRRANNRPLIPALHRLRPASSS